MPTDFFAKFSTIAYSSMDGSSTKTLAVDIFQRLSMRNKLLKDYLVFYGYSVKDGETPEIIAHKLYGSSGYHWIVLLANPSIVDPYYDWPMSQDNLNRTIQAQYGTPTLDGLIYAYQTIHHYQDAMGNVIDETTYQNLPANQRSAVMIYDWMVAQNEAKRQIQLIDANYVDEIDAEADSLLAGALV